MDMITINLERNEIPLYIQLYNFIKDEIQYGNIKSDEKLPSKRKLSNYLGISQNTIESAYEQLIAEGYIVSISKKGYYVSDIKESISMSNINFIKNENDKNIQNYKYEFLSSRIDLEYFPYDIWRKIVKDIIKRENKSFLQIGHSQGDKNLREAISNYLRYSRGVNSNADNIVIGAGTEYLMQIIINLLGQDKIYAMENPGYYKIKKILETNNLDVKPIDIDNQGINIEKLYKSYADIVHITPSHQFPSGVIMPISRRLKLLSWANEKSYRYIVEDDYDSEFRFEGRPIPALQSLDKDKVIYIGTFSKCFAPAIRVAYMVLPMEIIKKYRENFSFYASTVSRIDQQSLYRFIQDGYFERHLNKMRNIYKKKREFLVAMIKLHLKNVEIIGTNAGLHLLLKVNNGMSESELINKAKEKEIKILGLSNSYFNNYKDESIIFLGYASLKNEEIEDAIILLKEVWNL